MYEKFTELLTAAGFELVARDDRLFDVFPKETREWGVELWEKWANKHVELVRIRVPYSEKNVTLYRILRTEIEAALLANQVLNLIEKPPVATGEEIFGL